MRFIQATEINLTPAGKYEARCLFRLADGNDECHFFKFHDKPSDAEIAVVAQNFASRSQSAVLIPEQQVPALPVPKRLGLVGRIALLLVRFLQRFVR